jgi:RecA/RadA recombinase
MIPASLIRFQIESALSQKISSALTPSPKMIRPVAPTGIEMLDDVLEGGLPIGAISEIVGPEGSGRTSVALSFLAHVTEANKVCAWVDVSNALDPTSAGATGVDLARMLWVRCGVIPQKAAQNHARFELPDQYLLSPTAKRGLHGGGIGPHPRSETKGLPQAVSGLLRQSVPPRHMEPLRQRRQEEESFEPRYQSGSSPALSPSLPHKPWTRIEQALKVTDLLLQAGGFSAIVLDMGSLTAEFVSRVPLATWFRYRGAAERTQVSILLLTQYSCAKSSAELLLRLQPGEALNDEATLFTGINHHIEVVRRRFAQTPAKVVPLRKPPQSETAADWQSRTTWAGRR